MDTFVYVDGFNLYYGAVKGTPYKWLNVRQLCELLLPKHNIVRVKYFTARVSAHPGDPDQPIRQQTFLRALATLRDFEIIYGHFLTKETYMPLAVSAEGATLKYAKVLRTDEKGSDVNLATHLLWDGFQRRYKAAVLLTNDSDLLEPVRIVATGVGTNGRDSQSTQESEQGAGAPRFLRQANQVRCPAGLPIPAHSQRRQRHNHETSRLVGENPPRACGVLQDPCSAEPALQGTGASADLRAVRP